MPSDVSSDMLSGVGTPTRLNDELGSPLLTVPPYGMWGCHDVLAPPTFLKHTGEPENSGMYLSGALSVTGVHDPVDLEEACLRALLHASVPAFDHEHEQVSVFDPEHGPVFEPVSQLAPAPAPVPKPQLAPVPVSQLVPVSQPAPVLTPAPQVGLPRPSVCVFKHAALIHKCNPTDPSASASGHFGGSGPSGSKTGSKTGSKMGSKMGSKKPTSTGPSGSACTGSSDPSSLKKPTPIGGGGGGSGSGGAPADQKALPCWQKNGGLPADVAELLWDLVKEVREGFKLPQSRFKTHDILTQFRTTGQRFGGQESNKVYAAPQVGHDQARSLALLQRVLTSGECDGMCPVGADGTCAVDDDELTGIRGLHTMCKGRLVSMLSSVRTATHGRPETYDKVTCTFVSRQGMRYMLFGRPKMNLSEFHGKDLPHPLFGKQTREHMGVAIRLLHEVMATPATWTEAQVQILREAFALPDTATKRDVIDSWDNFATFAIPGRPRTTVKPTTPTKPTKHSKTAKK